MSLDKFICQNKYVNQYYKCYFETFLIGYFNVYTDKEFNNLDEYLLKMTTIYINKD